MAHHLGKYVLPQQMRVGKHPFLDGKEVVIISQHLSDFEDPGIFVPIGRDQQPSIDFKACRPELFGSIRDFVDRSKMLFDEAALLPDTVGRANVVLDKAAGLQLIDGLPITTQDEDVQQMILGQLNALDAELQAAA